MEKQSHNFAEEISKLKIKFIHEVDKSFLKTDIPITDIGSIMQMIKKYDKYRLMNNHEIFFLSDMSASKIEFIILILKKSYEHYENIMNIIDNILRSRINDILISAHFNYVNSLNYINFVDDLVKLIKYLVEKKFKKNVYYFFSQDSINWLLYIIYKYASMSDTNMFELFGIKIDYDFILSKYSVAKEIIYDISMSVDSKIITKYDNYLKKIFNIITPEDYINKKKNKFIDKVTARVDLTTDKATTEVILDHDLEQNLNPSNNIPDAQTILEILGYELVNKNKNFVTGNLIKMLTEHNLISDENQLAKIFLYFFSVYREFTGLVKTYPEEKLETYISNNIDRISAKCYSEHICEMSNMIYLCEYLDSYESIPWYFKNNDIINLVSLIFNIKFEIYHPNLTFDEKDQTITSTYKDSILIYEITPASYYLIKYKDEPFVPLYSSLPTINNIIDNFDKIFKGNHIEKNSKSYVEI